MPSTDKFEKLRDSVLAAVESISRKLQSAFLGREFATDGDPLIKIMPGQKIDFLEANISWEKTNKYSSEARTYFDLDTKSLLPLAKEDIQIHVYKDSGFNSRSFIVNVSVPFSIFADYAFALGGPWATDQANGAWRDGHRVDDEELLKRASSKPKDFVFDRDNGQFVLRQDASKNEQTVEPHIPRIAGVYEEDGGIKKIVDSGKGVNRHMTYTGGPSYGGYFFLEFSPLNKTENDAVSYLSISATTGEIYAFSIPREDKDNFRLSQVITQGSYIGLRDDDYKRKTT